jgi:EAL domain-containing protein (putative c-di-GMP-specific phosphodiesterase class I)
MQVVAEGIESREQLLQLNQMGCDFGQGYLFSKPLSGPDTVRLLNMKQPRGHLVSSGMDAPGVA